MIFYSWHYLGCYDEMVNGSAGGKTTKVIVIETTHLIRFLILSTENQNKMFAN
jgi:hypothetical protein